MEEDVKRLRRWREALGEMMNLMSGSGSGFAYLLRATLKAYDGALEDMSVKLGALIKFYESLEEED